MNDYELSRQAKIKKNQALLAELDIKPVISREVRNKDGKPPTKKRKVSPMPPSRTSARIAAAPIAKSYNEDEIAKPIALPRSVRSKAKGKGKRAKDEVDESDETEPLVPAKNVEEIQAGWSNWKSTAPPPSRDEDGTLRFEDYEDFTPNKSPEEMLREGCFGGSYYRPLRSRKLGIVVEGDWEELPKEWIDGLNVERFLTSPDYDPDVNKYKVPCGQSIEEWEAAGWISHEHDVRGWFQWYARFYLGRRCEDDARQVGRWRKCVGDKGRWRRMLLKRYKAMGVRSVFDDGEEEEVGEVSPVVHQTCHHWGWEVRQDVLDAYWAE
ncbi:hypothetical protein CLAFUW4_04278 [Fulvia fulva]|uniref:Vegetatible incompatibility protein HET-E-1 n=1 Tax=Passalora fulva TaxID=5499 RepID=A0A9Q8P8D4_PASFU|nr:uncharacterized protein CLAFUR5_04243 [Fulvia fulva]KAK4626849.1 hypothetical protein CLAFUR4_04264 [Fulvia fulva]KAK4628322.1 hypothetical protein CLAFUR0_04266 [Fulvia fulva]UJO16756.1 hypothetical protein CLAFUR5_04243 [Fulvia fulva]WPV14046.1 hypothetical protein CLAFUW4_04278 [Fulvia fulva]WPV29002.1 hypothetical protein CLAFUW7_04267 [Fulvia fulva]